MSDFENQRTLEPCGHLETVVSQTSFHKCTAMLREVKGITEVTQQAVSIHKTCSLVTHQIDGDKGVYFAASLHYLIFSVSEFSCVCPSLRPFLPLSLPPSNPPTILSISQSAWFKTCPDCELETRGCALPAFCIPSCYTAQHLAPIFANLTPPWLLSLEGTSPLQASVSLSIKCRHNSTYSTVS